MGTPISKWKAVSRAYTISNIATIVKYRSRTWPYISRTVVVEWYFWRKQGKLWLLTKCCALLNLLCIEGGGGARGLKYRPPPLVGFFLITFFSLRLRAWNFLTLSFYSLDTMQWNFIKKYWLVEKLWHFCHRPRQVSLLSQNICHF